MGKQLEKTPAITQQLQEIVRLAKAGADHWLLFAALRQLSNTIQSSYYPEKLDTEDYTEIIHEHMQAIKLDIASAKHLAVYSFKARQAVAKLDQHGDSAAMRLIGTTASFSQQMATARKQQHQEDEILHNLAYYGLEHEPEEFQPTATYDPAITDFASNIYSANPDLLAQQVHESCEGALQELSNNDLGTIVSQHEEALIKEELGLNDTQFTYATTLARCLKTQSKISVFLIACLNIKTQDDPSNVDLETSFKILKCQTEYEQIDNRICSNLITQLSAAEINDLIIKLHTENIAFFSGLGLHSTETTRLLFETRKMFFDTSTQAVVARKAFQDGQHEEGCRKLIQACNSHQAENADTPELAIEQSQSILSKIQQRVLRANQSISHVLSVTQASQPHITTWQQQHQQSIKKRDQGKHAKYQAKKSQNPFHRLLGTKKPAYEQRPQPPLKNRHGWSLFGKQKTQTKQTATEPKQSTSCFAFISRFFGINKQRTTPASDASLASAGKATAMDNA